MRAKSMVLIMIAAGCGLVASIGISQVMDQKGGAVVDAPMEKIYVAMADIAIGTKLDDKKVQLEPWPKDRLPQGAITKIEDIKDKFTKERVRKGEPIVDAMISSNRGTATDNIPEGMRVVNVKVSIEQVGFGLISPGDRVDMLVTMRKGPDVPATITKTVLRDVCVFAVGADTDQIVDEKGKQMSAQTVGLLVAPTQVQKVMLAQELGRIHFSLRRQDDKDNPTDEQDTSVKDILGVSESGEPKEQEQTGQRPVIAAGPQNNPGFNDFLKNLTKNQVKPSALPAKQPKDEAFTMTIFSAEGARHLQWQNPFDLPREVAQNTAPGNIMGGPKPPADPRALVGSDVDISGTTLQGQPFNLAQIQGQRALVVFWASWCPACRGEMPMIQGLVEKYRERGLDIVTVSLDDEPTAASKFLVDQRISWPTFVGPEAKQLAEKHGIKNIPTIMLVDKSGRLSGVGQHVAEVAPQVEVMFGGATSNTPPNTTVAPAITPPAPAPVADADEKQLMEDDEPAESSPQMTEPDDK